MGERMKIRIRGMSCDHCVVTITEGLSKIDGVTQVNVDLEGSCANVETAKENPKLRMLVSETIEELGYDVEH